MNHSIDGIINELAARQHGVVTRAQLLEAGVTARAVEFRVRSGRLRPLHRGVYLPGSLRGALEPERARVMAGVFACGPRAVVSHVSAGWLWGLLPRPDDASPVDVTIRGGGRRRRPGVWVRRPTDLRENETTHLDGIPVTAPPRTLRDLSTVLDVRALNRAAARAERSGLIEAELLPSLVAGHRGRPGASVLRAAVGCESGLSLTRSEAEERFLALVASVRLPAPEVNVDVIGYEVDFLWRAARIVVEVDGFAFHRSRRSFENDRRRDTDLAAAGFNVIRVTWRQIERDPTGTLVRIGQALARATAA